MFERCAHPTALPALVLTGLMLSACGGGGGGNDTGGASVDEQIENGSASGPREFGPPDQMQIRPGVEISSDFGSCTSNFIYYLNASTYFIGTAAHCFSADTNSGIDPCESASLQPGEKGIRIENAEHEGTLAYSSWVAMQENGESPGSDVCAVNDFALIRIDERDLPKVHPAAIAYGGPTGLYGGLASVSDRVYTFGQSPFHAGVSTLQQKEGEVIGVSQDGRNYDVQTDNPGLSGDSGSAVLHEDGRALGALTTVQAGLGVGGVSNGVINLERALNYARPFVGNVQLETWSEFTP